ncbi:MAG: hypothetical protein GOV00_03705 [Candidatus Altiarchaeota archaeon]|nr:hypothetical protein [Candidatus Altiarchaeota archaeon]
MSDSKTMRCRHCRFFRRDWHCSFHRFEPPSATDDVQCGNFVPSKSK